MNAPVLGPDGRVALIAIMAEDVTDRLNRFMSAVDSDGLYEDLGNCQESRPARGAVPDELPSAWHDGQRHDGATC